MGEGRIMSKFLSDEEMSALEGQQTESAPMVNQPETAVAQPDLEVNDAESFARGAIEGLPLQNQIVAGTKALLDNTPTSFGERYNRNLTEWRAAQEKSKTDDPYIFGTGEVVGDIGGFIAAPGGAAVMKLGAWTLGKHVSAHPANSIGQHLQNAAFDTAIGVAGGKALEKGMEIAAPMAKSLATNTTIAWLTDGAKGLKKDVGEHVSKFFNSGENKGLSSLDAHHNFVEELRSMKVGDKALLHANSTSESILKDARVFKERLSPEYDRILNSNTAKHNVESLENSLLSDLKISSNDPVTQATKLATEQEVRKTFSKVKYVDVTTNGVKNTVPEYTPKELTLTELQTLRNDISRRINWDDPTAKVANEMLYDRHKKISNFMEDIMSKSDEAILPQWKEVNRQWANANLIETITAAKGDPNIGGSVITGMRKSMNLMGTGAGVISMGLGAPLPVAIGVGIAAREALRRGEAMSPKLANGLDRLAKHLIHDPNSKISMGVVAAGAGTASYFHDHVMGAVSTLNLQDSPLERTVVDVQNRSDDILQVVQKLAPQQTDILRKAIDSRDEATISTVMEQVSKLPEARKLIKDGVGWNGKVTDPNDIQNLHKQVDSMNISMKQKLQHKQALTLSGTIPVLQKEVPYYIDYKARNKQEPNY